MKINIMNNPVATKFLSRALLAWGVFACGYGGIDIARNLTNDFNSKAQKNIIELSESYYQKADENRFEEITPNEVYAASEMHKSKQKSQEGVVAVAFGACLLLGSAAVGRRYKKQVQNLRM